MILLIIIIITFYKSMFLRMWDAISFTRGKSLWINDLAEKTHPVQFITEISPNSPSGYTINYGCYSSLVYYCSQNLLVFALDECNCLKTQTKKIYLLTDAVEEWPRTLT